MPVVWAMSFPWHLGLSLISLSLVLGFSFEYLLHNIFHHTKWISMIGGLTAVMIGLSTISVNQANIDFAEKKYGFDLALARNALLNPPDIKNKLNANSVIVIEDNTFNHGYILGNLYPLNLLYTIGTYDIHAMEATQSRSYFKFQSTYAGTYFRYAYLMPDLKEEVVPFNMNEMSKVPDIVFYKWLAHFDNIFCLGYDAAGNWHDRTAQFKEKVTQ